MRLYLGAFPVFKHPLLTSQAVAILEFGNLVDVFRAVVIVKDFLSLGEALVRERGTLLSN
jgi:hypothetical protein